MRYWIVVLGPDRRALGQASLKCVNEREAAVTAFLTASPFGHELWSDGGFLGRFEPALSIDTNLTPLD